MIRFGALIAAVLITLGLAACQASDPPLPKGHALPTGRPLPTGHPPGPWQLKFDDEFDGPSLNMANWSKGWLAPGITPPVNAVELECYNPANAEVSDGALVLSLTGNPNHAGEQSALMPAAC